MKKVFVYVPYAIWNPHFETDLELIKLRLDAGCDVTVLYCNSDMPICEPNYEHDSLTCKMCISRFKSGAKWLNNPNVHLAKFKNLTGRQCETIDSLMRKRFDTVQDLKSFLLDDVPLGRAAASSLITQLREPRPDMNACAGLVSAYLVSAATVWFSLRNHLEAAMPDELILFNARFASLMPALFAARSLGIKVYVHERAGVQGRYSLSENTYPHDYSYYKQQIEDVWNNSILDEARKHEIADSWYMERYNNIAQGWISFTEQQDATLLPDIDPGRLNVAIFNSSLDEFESIPGWESPYYENQNMGIRKMAEGIDPSRVRLMLRVHPNLRGVNNSQTEEFYAIARDNPHLELIPADSQVSSYALMKAVDCVITFGSTVGVEAVYHGTSSILMGRAGYDDLGCCIKPDSHEGLIEMLNNMSRNDLLKLIPESIKSGAVNKYGFFAKEWGFPYRYVKQVSVYNAVMSVNGEDIKIKPSRMLRLFNSISKRLPRLSDPIV